VNFCAPHLKGKYIFVVIDLYNYPFGERRLIGMLIFNVIGDAYVSESFSHKNHSLFTNFTHENSCFTGLT
jgi:hypothetical protein